MMGKGEAYLLAGQAGISETALRKFAHSRSPSLRMRIAENTNTPIDVLCMLANDDQTEVRLAAICNETAPDNLLNTVLNDADPTARYELAANACAKLWVLLALAEDENPYVQWRARKTLKRLMN
ncbi:MAG: hypothetical protein K2X77_07250 [Candidatus Obscuribacterales bacterium]|nr:hypothetical protein [Candidatus Obscuribacterales bacterium]